MNVEVTILVSVPPQKSDLQSLRSAASELSNQQTRITVNVMETEGRFEDEGRFALVTRFVMKTAAQYKVVDKISDKFEFWTWNLEGYQDMIISFPR